MAGTPDCHFLTWSTLASDITSRATVNAGDEAARPPLAGGESRMGADICRVLVSFGISPLPFEVVSISMCGCSCLTLIGPASVLMTTVPNPMLVGVLCGVGREEAGC